MKRIRKDDNLRVATEPDPKQSEDGGLLNVDFLDIMSTRKLSDKRTSEMVLLSAVETRHETLATSGKEIASENFPPIPRTVPFVHLKKKLLVLDLNGMLVDIVSPPPKEYEADINISRRAIFRRPFCLDFLDFCFERFEVGVWSSRTKKNIDKVIDYLMGDMKLKLLFCWDLSHCTTTPFKTLENKHKPLVFKDLRRLWEELDPKLQWQKGYYNESNTLLIDDSPYKALLNPDYTAIFPYPFQYWNRKDDSLGDRGDLRLYLQELEMADSVQKFVAEHPFGQAAITEKSATWNFYHHVIGSSCSPQVLT